jgi:hypothetical protein
MSSKPNFAVSGNRQGLIARSHPSAEPGTRAEGFVRLERSLNTKKFEFICRIERHASASAESRHANNMP